MSDAQVQLSQEGGDGTPVSHPVTQFISPSAWALIETRFSRVAKEKLAALVDFVITDCLPSESLYHASLPLHPYQERWNTVIPIMEELKIKAKKKGLWNLFLSEKHYPGFGGGGLTNLEYAVMAEVMGYSPHLASQACNCSAPDTGNMEVLARYGNRSQQERYLLPLLSGKIRSSFAMTEYGVASSDATNLRGTIRRDEKTGEVVVNCRKWWISGAGDPRNEVHILIGLSDPTNPSKHKRHTIVLIPPKSKGVTIKRPLGVFGYDDAPEGHCEVLYDEVRVGEDMIVGGWGSGFEIIQGRLGPGRIHHCMRSIGTAQRALDLMLQRVSSPSRKTFGKQLSEHGTILADIARSRAEIDGARLLVLSAANMIDGVRAKGAMKDIGIAKFTVPAMALQVVDRAMQAFGAEGLCQDQPLAEMYAHLRTLRYADGPDEVHLQQIGKQELKRVPELVRRTADVMEREQQLIRSTEGGLRRHDLVIRHEGREAVVKEKAKL